MKEVVAKHGGGRHRHSSDGVILEADFHGLRRERLGGLATCRRLPSPTPTPSWRRNFRLHGTVQRHVQDDVDAERHRQEGRRRCHRRATGRQDRDGPITYQGQTQVKRDIDKLQGRAAGHSPSSKPSCRRPRRRVRTSTLPGIYKTEQGSISLRLSPTHDARRVQGDRRCQASSCSSTSACPPVTRFCRIIRIRRPRICARFGNADRSLQSRAAWHSPEKVRYHLCWGSMNTPHTTDVPLKEIIDLILISTRKAYSIEAANPRHTSTSGRSGRT